jgi:hypothetical protein
MIDPTSFTRYPAAILYEGESDNMASSWQEYIIATRTDNGIYAVYAKKYVEENKLAETIQYPELNKNYRLKQSLIKFQNLRKIKVPNVVDNWGGGAAMDTILMN